MSRARDLADLGNNAGGLETLTVSDITDLNATATELNYVDGVGSAIQTQLDAKAPTASPTFSGTTNFNNTYVSNANLKNIGAIGGGIFRDDTNSSNWHYTNSVDTGSASYTANTNITIVPENALVVGAYWGYVWFSQGTTWPGDRCSSAMCSFTILNTWGTTFHSFVTLPTGSRLTSSGDIQIRAFGTVTNQRNGIHARCTNAVGSGSGTNVHCNIRLMRML